MPARKHPARVDTGRPRVSPTAGTGSPNRSSPRNRAGQLAASAEKKRKQAAAVAKRKELVAKKKKDQQALKDQRYRELENKRSAYIPPQGETGGTKKNLGPAFNDAGEEELSLIHI